VTLGDVIRQEREKKSISVDQAAAHLELSIEDYALIESGGSPLEEWAPKLASLAIQLKVPMSRLMAESGRSVDCRPGQLLGLAERHLERARASMDPVAEPAGMTPGAKSELEERAPLLERYGRLLLAFAELIEEPVFNLVYPCGVPFQTLQKYP
jgi:transcriptional regulator with XRE-family HTH domain